MAVSNDKILAHQQANVTKLKALHAIDGTGLVSPCRIDGPVLGLRDTGLSDLAILQFPRECEVADHYVVNKRSIWARV